MDPLVPWSDRDSGRLWQSCSSRAWNEQWQWQLLKMFWSRGMVGYSEVHERGSSRIWREMRSDRRKWGIVKPRLRIEKRIACLSLRCQFSRAELRPETYKIWRMFDVWFRGYACGHAHRHVHPIESDLGWSDVTESMVMIRTPFWGYNTT